MDITFSTDCLSYDDLQELFADIAQNDLNYDEIVGILGTEFIAEIINSMEFHTLDELISYFDNTVVTEIIDSSINPNTCAYYLNTQCDEDIKKFAENLDLDTRKQLQKYLKINPNA